MATPENDSERLRTLLRFLPVVIWEVDENGIVTQSEGRGLAALGFRPGELVGRSVFDIYGDNPRVHENARRAMAGEEFTDLTDLGGVFLEVRMGPKRDATGRVIGIAGMGIDVTERVRMANAVHGLSRRLWAVLEEDRRRISREIHDEAGQTVTALKLLLDRASRSADPKEVQCLLQEGAKLCGCVLEELRRISHDLTPGSLDVLGLRPSIEELVMRFERAAGIEVRLDAPPLLPDVDKDAQAAIYRFVQEALTNVSRHAHASRVAVRLAADERGLSVETSDDGVGFVPSEALTGSGLGLIGMKERSRMLGGTLAIESAPGRGTRIRLDLPLVSPPAPL